MNIIQCYAPTSDRNDDIIDQFYEWLQSTLEKCRRNNLIIPIEPDGSYLHQQKIPNDKQRCESQERNPHSFRLPSSRGQFKIEAKKELDNRLQTLQDLLKEEENTMEDNWKGIKETLNSTCQGVLGLKKHHHKEWISIETLEKIKERKTNKTEINNTRTRAEKVQAQAEYIEANKPAPMNPLDIEAAHTDLPIDVNPPTKEEIRMAIRQIKNGIAA
ncbi:unnamed protein product [Schistosoma margrebowiei]|uniref:Uncharacterized protein n=1 Tax=Schistosoma margrebowiei TaxID=48269 RepID=A0A183MES8_9TREM|nr:unnamed protein product [Schistosoma margrebowiei]